MNKKTLFAIGVFIVAGFFMYTFANPLNDNENQAQQNGNTVTPVDNNGTGNETLNNNEQKNVDNNNNNQQNNQNQNQNNNNNAVANNNNQGNAQNNGNQQNNVNNELADVIAKAKEELSNYKKDVDLNEEYQKKYDDTKEDGIKSLDDAKSIDEVNGSLAESKGKIDTIIADDLSAYKKAAKENILAYANELKVLDITTLIIDDANTLIDDATTKSAIDTIVNDAKTKLDEVLNAKKKEALEELENYTEYVFSENNLEKFNNIIDTTVKNITEAADLDSVNKALKDGEELIDQLIGKDFADYKADKIDYLTHYNEETIYSDKNTALIKEYKKEGIDAINDITNNDKEAVNGALNNALDKINALDNTAPVITLDGNTYIELFKTTGHYNLTQGLSVSDDRTNLTVSDVKIKIVKNNIAVVEKVNYSKVGKYVINYSVSDEAGNTATASRTVVVKEILLDRISVTPSKTYYYVGDKLGSIKVVAYYNNETSKEVTNYKVKGFDNTKANNGKVIVSYTEDGITKSDSFNYTVESIKLSSIKVTPSKTYYYVGDKLGSIKVVAYYNNKTSKEVTNYKVNGFDNTKANNGKVIVSYTEDGITKSDSFNYTVESIKLSSIKITPSKTSYFVGDKLGSIKVVACYNNGSRKEVTDYKVNGFDTTNPGRGTAKVSYTENGRTKSKTFDYVVNAILLDHIKVTPSKTTYYVDDEMGSIEVVAYYNNNTSNTITEYDITGFDASSTGNGKVTVSYTENEITKSDSFDYVVNAKVLDHIVVTPSKTTYFLGENLGSLEVVAYYTNNTHNTVNGYIVSGYHKNVAGEGTVTVSYTENEITKSDSFKYLVNYTEDNLKNLFSKTTAELEHIVHLFHSDEYYIYFYNLPVNAKIISVKRSDKPAAELTLVNGNKYSLDSDDYMALRHNWGHTIYITYSVNGQEYTRGYSESFGEID